VIVQVVKDGQKNFSILIKGLVRGDFEATPIINTAKIQAPNQGWKGLRLDSALWLVQEKMGLYLWWRKPEGEEDLALVMESRNGLRFDEGLPSPRVEKGWDGLMYLSSFNHQGGGPKGFVVLLDFDKQ
jgi:hypothetical protein